MKEYYQKAHLEKIVKDSFSLSEVLRNIGLKPLGSNFKTLKKYIDLYSIDISHFRGQTWNKGMANTDYAAYNKLKDVLKKDVNFKSDTLKYRLIKEGLKQWKCEKCGNEGIWENEELILEIHHINGDHYDNRLENLQILCPNCHSQTENYRNRAKRKRNIEAKQRKTYMCKCEYCGKLFNGKKESNRFCCREHYNLFLEKNQNKPIISKELLQKEMNISTTISDLANKLHTSRPTIRKYLKEYNLYENFIKNNITNMLHTRNIIQYDLNMNKIKEWDSITNASKTLGITTIDKCLNFKRKTAGGFIWRYKDCNISPLTDKELKV